MNGQAINFQWLKKFEFLRTILAPNQLATRTHILSSEIHAYQDIQYEWCIPFAANFSGPW